MACRLGQLGEQIFRGRPTFEFEVFSGIFVEDRAATSAIIGIEVNNFRTDFVDGPHPDRAMKHWFFDAGKEWKCYKVLTSSLGTY